MRERKVVSNNVTHGQFGNTTLTKVFVGGLAWETPKEALREHFDKYGEILEAVIISDKLTGRSKGYGFVTFKEPEEAKKACEDATPAINGRRANCNLASLGARCPRSASNTTPPPQRGSNGGGARPMSPAPAPSPANHVQWYYPAPAGTPSTPFRPPKSSHKQLMKIMAFRSMNHWKQMSTALRGYATSTSPKMKSYSSAAGATEKPQQSNFKRFMRGEFVPVYVVVGMIAVSVGLGLHTAKQHLRHNPHVYVKKERREMLPEVVEPERVVEESDKFVFQEGGACSGV